MRLFDNLRMLPHAPGVQMANIPEDGVSLKDDSEAADEADPDKRNPPQLKDKQIEPDNEFEDAPGKSGNRDELTGKDVDTLLKKDTAAKDTEEAMEVDEAKTDSADSKTSPPKEAAASATAAAASS
jgi:histone deacetylase 1/2